MARDLRSYKTKGPVKLKWTTEDVPRLSDRTLRSQYNAAHERLATAKYYASSAKDPSAAAGYKERASTISKYYNAIDEERKRRKK